MTASSSKKQILTKTGFLKSEMDKTFLEGNVQSVGFLAGAKSLSKRSASRTTYTNKPFLGKTHTEISEDPLFKDVNTKISEEQAAGAVSASQRREMEIRRRVAAPGRDGGLFLAGVL